jgi:nucleoside-diphosphate-sugar epimerase
VGSDDAISVCELARQVAACLERPTEIQVAREPVPGQLPERYVPDITRLSAELDLRPRQPVERGLRQALAWAAEALSGEPATLTRAETT